MNRMKKPLGGRKIGVLQESLYIAAEIAPYQDDFAEMGAEEQLISRLWGSSSALLQRVERGAELYDGWILIMADKKSWLQLLAYVTSSVNQELLLCNEYLAAENRVLKSQIYQQPPNRRLQTIVQEQL